MSGTIKQETLEKLFPLFKENKPQFFVRIFIGALLAGMPLIAFFSKNTSVAAGYEGLWFQAFGAATLWWESNTQTRVRGAIDEIRSFHLTRLTHETENKINRSELLFMIVISVLSSLGVGLTLFARSATLATSIEYTIGTLAVEYTALSRLGWYLRRLHERLSTRLASLGDFEDIRLDVQEDYARRVVRSFGFLLFLVSAIVQILPIMLSQSDVVASSATPAVSLPLIPESGKSDPGAHDPASTAAPVPLSGKR